MNMVMKNIEDVTEAKRRKYLQSMIDKGIQIPLEKMMNRKQIQSLQIIDHVLHRYKQRYAKLHDIQIEQEIKNSLLKGAMIVGNGHSDRWFVFSKGFIFVIDQTTIYTTYDANGRDRNNILDPTKAQLNAVNKKSKTYNRINDLFELIKREDASSIHV